MKVITKYQARDNREFNLEKDCREHEVLLDKIDGLNSILTKGPDSCDFANGEGYIQHSNSQLIEFKDKLIDLFKETVKGFDFVTDKTHVSYFIRVTGDCGSPLQNCFQRLYCIDSEFREWGQPYFGLNPEKGKQVKLNLG